VATRVLSGAAGWLAATVENRRSGGQEIKRLFFTGLAIARGFRLLVEATGRLESNLREKRMPPDLLFS